MKMKMSVRDRLVVSTLYPQKSGLQDQIIVKDISKKLEISQAEAKEIDLVSNGQGLSWDDKKCKDKEIDFTESEIRFLKNQVKESDEKKEVTAQIVDLCLKIKDLVIG